MKMHMQNVSKPLKAIWSDFLIQRTTVCTVHTTTYLVIAHPMLSTRHEQYFADIGGRTQKYARHPQHGKARSRNRKDEQFELWHCMPVL